MKVYNITYSYINNNYKNCQKPAFTSLQSDTFVKNQQGLLPLKEITSKTAQLLYGTDYTPKSIPEEGYYLTHALDKETLKPVDIFVQKGYCNADSTKYLFYRKAYNGILKLVGVRQVKFSDEIQKIIPSDYYMISHDKSLLGIGLLEHQIAIEEMLKRGYKNVEIDAIQSAYDFHKKAGFRSTDCYVYRPSHRLTASVYEWCDRLKENERTVRDLFVFKPDSEVPMLNQNKTIENIVLYIKKSGKKIMNDDIKIHMELPTKALEEWKKIIARKPILIDTNFHPKV